MHDYARRVKCDSGWCRGVMFFLLIFLVNQYSVTDFILAIVLECLNLTAEVPSIPANWLSSCLH